MKKKQRKKKKKSNVRAVNRRHIDESMWVHKEDVGIRGQEKWGKSTKTGGKKLARGE